MNKYKKIVVFLLTTVLMSFVICYASWIIGNSVIFNASYNASSHLNYLEENLNNQEKIYDGQYSYPTTSNQPNIFNNSAYVVDLKYKSFESSIYSTYSQNMPKDAGVYQITFGDGNISKTINYTINKREVVIAWTNTLFEYDGESHIPTATLSNIVDGDTCTPTLTGENSAAGAYVATITQLSNPNYCLPANASTSFTINSSNQLMVRFFDNDGTTLLNTIYVDSGDTVTPPQYTYNSYQYDFSWVNMSTSEEATFTNITSNTDIKVSLQVKSYNVTVYFIDKDNQASRVKTNTSSALTTYTQVYNFVNNVGTISGTYQFGDIINVSKQIRIYNKYNYYYDSGGTAYYYERYLSAFYMSPASSYDWNVTGSSNDNFLTYVDGSNLSIVVMCVQPLAIVSTGALDSSTKTSGTTGTYYKNINEAFEAAKNATSTTYLRILGQQRGANDYEFGSANCNTTVAAHDVIINNHTYSVPATTVNESSYTLNTYDDGSSNTLTINQYLKVILTYNGYNDYSNDGYLTKEDYNKEKQNSTSYRQHFNVPSSVMVIPSNLTLNLNNSFMVGGVIFGAFTEGSRERGVLINNGTINVQGSNTFSSYGYTKGTGVINLSSSATAVDVFTLYNSPGSAQNCKGLYDSGLFPFINYTIHNISCKTIIPYGAKYNTFLQCGGYTLGWYQAGTLTMIGSGGLFSLASGGYIEKYVEDTTSNTNINSYTTSNRNGYQRDVIDVYGGFSDGTVSVTVKVTLITASLKTGTATPMPICNMHICLKSGNGTLSANSYKFLPGSILEVEPGAKLTLGSSASMVFYEQYYSSNTYHSAYRSAHTNFYSGTTVKDEYKAKFIVNGEFESNGSFGGLIQTTSNTGKVTLSKNSATIKQYSTGTDSVNETTNSKMYIYQNGSVATTPIDSGTGSYYSIKDSSNRYGFYATNINVSFDSCGGSTISSVINVTIGASGYTIASDINSNNAYKPTRANYNFDGWYLDSSYTNSAPGKVVYCSTILYAKWSPIVYNIIYDFDQLSDGNPTNGTEVNNPNNPSTYNALSNSLLYLPTYGDYVFDGWYLNSNFTQKITSVVGTDVLSSLSSPYTLTLYGRWYPSGTTTYRISYNNPNTDAGCTCIAYEDILSTNTSNYATPTLNAKNNDKEYPKYFEGWYLDSSYSTKYTNPSQITGDTTLFARWVNKNPVEFYFQNTRLEGYTYYLPINTSFTIPNASNYNFSEVTGYVYEWTITGGLCNGNKYRAGDVVQSLSSTYGEVIKVSADLAALEWTLTIKCGSNETLTYIVKNKSGTQVANGSVAASSSTTVQVYTDYTVTISITPSSDYNAGTISTTNTSATSPYTITGTANPTISVGNASKQGCVTSDALITLADGTVKPISELAFNDKVLSWDFNTGTFVESDIILLINHGISKYKVLHLIFEEGYEVDFIETHGLFDMTTMKFEYLNITNVDEYINHEFAIDSTYKVKLLGYTIEEKETGAYSIYASYSGDVIVNDMITMTPPIEEGAEFFGFFDVLDDLTFDMEQIEKDIETYGLYDYSMFEPYITYEQFDKLNGKYLKIAVEKGIITWNQILDLIGFISPYFE